MEFTENCIEFLTGESVATITLSQRAQITKFKKLHREHPRKFGSDSAGTDGGGQCLR